MKPIVMAKYIKESALNNPKISHPCGFPVKQVSCNLQDLEIIESVSCKLREDFIGSEAANAQDSRVIQTATF